MRNYPISPVNPSSTLLGLAESIRRNQRKQGQGNDGQCEKADEQTSIRGGIQRVSRSGPSAVRTLPKRALAAYSAILPDPLHYRQRKGSDVVGSTTGPIGFNVTLWDVETPRPGWARGTLSFALFRGR